MRVDRILSLLFFAIALICVILLALYLSNKLPQTFYNRPFYEEYAQVVNKADPQWRIWYLHYWLDYKVCLTLFLSGFFSFLYGVGSYKRSVGKRWHIIKKDFFTNFLGYGLLALGVLLFAKLWPTDPVGTTKWSWLLLAPPSFISFLFLYSEPISIEEQVVPISANDRETTFNRYQGLKTACFVIASIMFIIGIGIPLWLVITASGSGEEGLGAAIIASISFLVFVPAGVITSIIAIYFKNKANQLNKVKAQSVSPSE